MKIEYVKGNLFETPWHVIVHGCNAQGVMGSGVARIVRDDWPEAYEEYVKYHKEHGLKLGQVIWAESNGKLIANAITQDNFGRTGEMFCDYDAIERALTLVNNFCADYNITHAAMPKIGAGLGGGDWNEIAPRIEHACTNVQPVVYVI